MGAFKRWLFIVIVVVVVITCVLVAGLLFRTYNNENSLINNQAEILRVIDGDTIVVKQGGVYIIRLAGIDCPEKGQPGFLEAKNFIKSKKVVYTEKPLAETRRGRYNRVISFLRSNPWRNAREINRDMVALGFCWSYGKTFTREESLAKKLELGVHADRGAIHPKNWRKGAR